APCTSPCSFQWIPGSSHSIAAASQAGPSGTQYVFASWSDSGAASHSVTTPASAASFTASFTTQYFLTTAASPLAGGSISPASGWFNAGSVLSLTASPNSGYAFSSFSGAVNAASSPQSLTLNAPASVTANFSVSSGGGSGTWFQTGGSWAYRKAVFINHTQVSGSTPLSNFPVLISLTDPNLQAFAKADASDMVFTSLDAVTKLNHEIDSFNPSTGQLSAWVSIPSLSPSTDTVLYLYYGNPSALPQQNPAGVWDANFGAVYHFSNAAADSTSQNNGAAVGSIPSAPGLIGSAASAAFSSSRYFDLGAAAGVQPRHTGTFQAWINPAALAVYNTFLANGAVATDLNGVQFWNAGPGRSWNFEIANGSTKNRAVSTATAAVGSWMHVAGTWDGASVKIFINGVLSGSAPQTLDPTPAYSTKIGVSGEKAYPFNGLIDE